MRAFRIIVVILFVLVTAGAAFVAVKQQLRTDSTIPEIRVENEMIEVSLKATNEELLQGVIAYDKKDKDLTDKIIVESISRFIEKGVSKVTYAVCDSDNNVAKATRLIRYTGYESPKFRVTGNLCFSLYEHIDIRTLVEATDSLEGNISSQLIVTSSDYSSSNAGAFSLNVTVTNQITFSKNLTLNGAVFKKSSSKLTADGKSVTVGKDTIVFDIPAGSTHTNDYKIGNKDYFVNLFLTMMMMCVYMIFFNFTINFSTFFILFFYLYSNMTYSMFL